MLPGGSSVTMSLQYCNWRHHPARLRGHLGQNTVEHRHMCINCLYGLPMNCGPLSDIIECGAPKSEMYLLVIFATA